MMVATASPGTPPPAACQSLVRLWSEGNTLVLDLATPGKAASGVVQAVVGGVIACGTIKVKPSGRSEIRLRAVVPSEFMRPWERTPLLWALTPDVDPTRIAIRGKSFKDFLIHVAAGQEA